MKLAALNGFKDILPDEMVLWRHLETVAEDILRRFHFSEIRLPILEKTELFARSLGATTDIVEKEMYTFADKQVTMRPEATASLMRSYIQHAMHAQKPVQRLFTIGPMFRHERPQKGRLRQFHQMSAEVIGSTSPRLDAELMAMGALLFDELKVEVSLEINSLGCPACRPAYRERLLRFIDTIIGTLCSDCTRRSTTNPLRVLDCKKPSCRAQVETAPSIIEHVCESCSVHFDHVRKNLERLDVSYRLNTFMVRGLDYYVRTTFEFVSQELGAQSAVCAGGRYDGLIEQLGGGKIAGIGLAMGLERLVLLLRQQGGTVAAGDELDIFLAGLGAQPADRCFELMHALRTAGLSADMDSESRSLKSQMKQADKANAAFVLIVGDDELAHGRAVLRNMTTKKQYDLDLDVEVIIEAVQNKP